MLFESGTRRPGRLCDQQSLPPPDFRDVPWALNCSHMASSDRWSCAFRLFSNLQTTTSFCLSLRPPRKSQPQLQLLQPPPSQQQPEEQPQLPPITHFDNPQHEQHLVTKASRRKSADMKHSDSGNSNASRMPLPQPLAAKSLSAWVLLTRLVLKLLLPRVCTR